MCTLLNRVVRTASRPVRPRRSPPPPALGTKLLHPPTLQQQVVHALKAFAPVKDAHLAVHPATGDSLRACYVEFQSVEHAQHTLETAERSAGGADGDSGSGSGDSSSDGRTGLVIEGDPASVSYAAAGAPPASAAPAIAAAAAAAAAEGEEEEEGSVVAPVAQVAPVSASALTALKAFQGRQVRDRRARHGECLGMLRSVDVDLVYEVSLQHRSATRSQQVVSCDVEACSLAHVLLGQG